MVSAIADETLELLQLTLRRPTEHEQLGDRLGGFHSHGGTPKRLVYVMEHMEHSI